MSHHKNRYPYSDNSGSLLKYYDFNEIPIPPTATLAQTVSTTETGLPVPLTLKRIRPNDQVELIATIDWATTLGTSATVNASFPTTAAAVTTVSTTVPFFVEVPVTFRVYRDGQLICTTTDFRTIMYTAGIPSTVTSTTSSTNVLGLALFPAIVPASASFGTPSAATTTFQCIDTGASKGDHVYSVTAQAGSSAVLSPITAIRTTSTSIPLIPVSFFVSSSPTAVVSSVNFSGKVIEGNDEFSHEYKNV